MDLGRGGEEGVDAGAGGGRATSGDGGVAALMRAQGGGGEGRSCWWICGGERGEGRGR